MRAVRGKTVILGAVRSTGSVWWRSAWRGIAARAAALALCLPVLFAGVAAAAGPDGPLFIRNVTVMTMTEDGVIERGAVLVRGRTIEAVAPEAALPVPEGARVLDGLGLFLTPGLIDAHVHLDHPSALETFVSNGITTVLNMRGSPETLRWRREIASGARSGPLIYTAGDIIESAPGTWEGFSLVDSKRDARALVRAQVRAGYDFIKVYHKIRPKHLRAIAKEARAAGLTVVGHAPEGVEPRRAAKLGLADFAHGMELLRSYESPGEAAGKARRIARDMRRSGAWVTPNLVYLDTLAREQENPSLITGNRDYGRLHPAMRQWFDPHHNPYAVQGAKTAAWNRRRFEAVRTLTKALHDKGVPLLAGSDALAAGIFPQSALFDELRLLSEAGLGPVEALKTATAGAGEFIRTHIDRKARLGFIAPGARADLLLVADDPRERVPRADSVRGVIAAGVPRAGWGGRAAGGALTGAAAARDVKRIAALAGAGKLREARAVYDAARAARPGELLFHRFAFLNLVRPLLLTEKDRPVTDAGRLEKAVIAYRMYTDSYPDLQIGYIRLAQALAGLGRCEEARAELDHAAMLSPGHPLIAETRKRCGE